jgi:hypothetical protein
MGNKITSKTIIAEAKKRFDFFSKSLDQEKNFYSGLGLHVIFGDIFNPNMISILQKEPDNPIIPEIFEFIEDMILSEDHTLVNVAVVTILERFGDFPELSEKYKDRIGKKSLEALKEVDEFWGRNEEIRLDTKEISD